MSRIETVSSDLKVLVREAPQHSEEAVEPKVLVRTGLSLPAQQVVPLPESPHQAAIAPDPVVEPTAPAATKPKRKRRARKADGTYQGDNPATPKNEAWTD